MEKIFFGKTKQNEDIYLYSFINKDGSKMIVTDYGATLVQLWVKNKKNELLDVVLGYDILEEYEINQSYFGVTIGRNANRIENGQFKIEGKNYYLDKNEGNNNLHSGYYGYQSRKWSVSEIDEEHSLITFTLNSPDGDQGFPGNLSISVTYQLLKEGIKISYYGLSDKDTIFNPTNHTYFNLNGHSSGSILNHRLQLNARYYTPIKDSKAIPTGNVESVKNTAFDFCISKKIGENIDNSEEQILFASGFDHNYVIEDNSSFFAKVKGDISGIIMEVSTNLPGFQFYSGNAITPVLGKESHYYRERSGLCLETQYFPNAINEEFFKEPVLKRGQEANLWTMYSFKSM